MSDWGFYMPLIQFANAQYVRRVIIGSTKVTIIMECLCDYIVYQNKECFTDPGSPAECFDYGEDHGVRIHKIWFEQLSPKVQDFTTSR